MQIFILFHGWIVFHHVCGTHTLICHIFFIHSSADEYLDYFYILQKMLLWILECMYLFKFVILFPTDIYTDLELLDDIVVLFIVFWGNSIVFSTMAAPTSISNNNVETFSFLHIQTSIFGSVLLIIANLRSVEVISIMFWIICSNCLAIIFMFLLVRKFGKISIQMFGQLFNWVVCFFPYWVVWAYYICWILTPYCSFHLQIFSPLFILLMSSLAV